MGGLVDAATVVAVAAGSVTSETTVDEDFLVVDAVDFLTVVADFLTVVVDFFLVVVFAVADWACGPVSGNNATPTTPAAISKDQRR